MKKLICLIVAVMILMTQLTSFAAKDITVNINGNNLDTPVSPMIVNDRTMVPFRAIFETLNMEVNWSEKHQKVHATNGDITIILTIGSDKMLVNTDIVTLDAAPFISNGSTLVPVRAITEALNCEVGWDGENRVVVIETADYDGPGYIAPEKEPEQEPEKEPEKEPEVPNSSEPPAAYIPIIDDNPAYINKNDPEMAVKAMNLINKQRVEYGLDELIIDDNISAVALGHSMDMAENNYIDHVSITGTTPFERLDMAGIYYTSASEILASGFITPEDVVNSWMNSPSHRQSIINSEFTHIGLGYWLGGPNGTYWTLVLAAR
ncbi:MAG: hypothetical protein II998_00305 [Clostridia bacterium]|nr:hypothetical protein [Clostridia bacterium]